MTVDVALAALRRHARDTGDAAGELLEGLLKRPAESGLWPAALEALGEVKTQRAADMVVTWAVDLGDAGMPDVEDGLGGPATRAAHKAARRALWRLAQAGIQPTPRDSRILADERPAPERVRRALMSAADAEGTRLWYLLLHPALGTAQMARVIASEGRGLLRFETRESSGRQFERYVTLERTDKEFSLAEVPGAYARWCIGQAAAVSRASGRALPADFLSFRADLEPPQADPEAPIQLEPLALELRYRPEPVEESVELLDLPEFALWMPQEEDLAPIVEEWRSTERGPLTLPPGVLAQRRAGIVDRVVDLIVGPGGVAGARRRLEDNALVMLRRGETRAARRALGAAMHLRPDDPAGARHHPFLRALAERASAVFAPPPAPEAGSRIEPPLGPGGASASATATPPDEVDPTMQRRPSGLILPR